MRRFLGRAALTGLLGAILLAVPIDVAGAVSAYPSVAAGGAARSAVAAPVAAAQGGSSDLSYVPLAPARLVETRTGAGKVTVDHQFEGGGAFSDTREYKIAGRGGVPATGVDAVVLNVTIVGAVGSGYTTVYPTGSALPNASNLNFGKSAPVANLVVAKIGTGGRVSIFNSTRSDLIVDVSGWYPTGSDYQSMTPVRLVDTRSGRSTVDGQHGGSGAFASAQNFTVTGRAGIPSNAGAVVLNVTVIGPSADGYSTVYPAGSTRPNASNVNYLRNGVVPNMVIAKIGSDGRVTVFNSARSDIAVDVAGWYPADGDYQPLQPARLIDTRPGRQTIDGTDAGWGSFIGEKNFKITGRGGVPASGVGAVVLNVTAMAADSWWLERLGGYTTVYPAGTPRPNASNVNYDKDSVVANLVVAKVGRSGSVTLFNLDWANVIVDVAGWYTGDPRSFVVAGEDSKALGQLADKVAVWVCKVPGSTDENSPTHTAAAVAAWAQSEAGAYFSVASRGRYAPTFTPLGSFSANDGDCLNQAKNKTGTPYSNVLVVDTTSSGNGKGGPGFIYQDGRADALTEPPKVSLRGLWVGGRSFYASPNRGVLIHEMGHAIGFPHSSWDRDVALYDNLLDVMSDSPETVCPSGVFCHAQHTIAFNRFKAGWVDDSEVVIQRRGVRQVSLAGPESTAGKQLIMAPSSDDPRALLTIEARPKSGLDQFLLMGGTSGGVAVHVIDQRPEACESGWLCAFLSIRQGPVVGPSRTYNHLLLPGQTRTFHGVIIKVGSAIAGGYDVTVSGTATIPAAPFAP